MTKAKSSKKSDHVLHQVLLCEIDECQPSLQWGDGERDECCITRVLLFILWVEVAKFEVLEVWEKPNEIQDLSAGASGLLKSKKSKHWREVPEALLNGRHEAGHIEMVYSEFLEVRKGGEVTRGTPVEPRRSEQCVPLVVQTDPELFDERE